MSVGGADLENLSQSHREKHTHSLCIGWSGGCSCSPPCPPWSSSSQRCPVVPPRIGAFVSSCVPCLFRRCPPSPRSSPQRPSFEWPRETPGRGRRAQRGASTDLPFCPCRWSSRLNPITRCSSGTSSSTGQEGRRRGHPASRSRARPLVRQVVVARQAPTVSVQQRLVPLPSAACPTVLAAYFALCRPLADGRWCCPQWRRRRGCRRRGGLRCWTRSDRASGSERTTRGNEGHCLSVAFHCLSVAIPRPFPDHSTAFP